MKGIIKPLLIFFCIISIHNSALAEEIIIGADIWCPYNCDPKNETEPGFMVELAKHIFAGHGIDVKYKEIPWSRAKLQVSDNIIQGLIAATPSNTSDLKVTLVFPEEEQGRMRNCFFTSKNSGWTYQGVSSLSRLQLGVIQDYDYGSEIQPYVEKKTNVHMMAGNVPLFRLIKMLQKQRIDVILEDEVVFKYTAAGINFTDYRFAGDDGTPPEKNNLYIALSPTDRSKEYAKMLTDGMRRLRQSGELSRILARYGLQDWK